MSNKVVRLLLLLGLAALPTAMFCSNVNGTNACEQEFTFECKTAGEYSVIKFVERRFGECQRTNRIALYLGPAGLPPMQLTDVWFAEEMIKNRPEERFVEIVDTTGITLLGDSITITPPPVDSVFADSMRTLLYRGTRMVDFYRDCHYGCIDEPIFNNAEVKLVWIYGSGLYKNYSIEKIIYFPDSGYVLIFTHQPIEFDWKITWHGVMLYRLVRN